MPTLRLLDLDLRAPLAYRGLENPPLSGIPRESSVPLPCPDGSVRTVAVGSGLDEGEEELFVLDADELVRFDPDDGPRLVEALPPPRFYGRAAGTSACSGCRAPCAPKGRPEGGAASGRAAGDGSGGAAPAVSSGAAGVAGPEWAVPAGRYLFMQWRPEDEDELREGLEWFARESWWDGNRGVGPYIVRRVKEDGKLATQALRRAEER